jgi:hypothetical protein
MQHQPNIQGEKPAPDALWAEADRAVAASSDRPRTFLNALIQAEIAHRQMGPDLIRVLDDRRRPFLPARDDKLAADAAARALRSARELVSALEKAAANAPEVRA